MTPTLAQFNFSKIQKNGCFFLNDNGHVGDQITVDLIKKINPEQIYLITDNESTTNFFSGLNKISIESNITSFRTILDKQCELLFNKQKVPEILVIIDATLEMNNNLEFQETIYNGRYYFITRIVRSTELNILKPSIRIQFDTSIFSNFKEQDQIYKNYFVFVPTFKLFEELIEQNMTNDKFLALYHDEVIKLTDHSSDKNEENEEINITESDIEQCIAIYQL